MSDSRSPSEAPPPLHKCSREDESPREGRKGYLRIGRDRASWIPGKRVSDRPSHRRMRHNPKFADESIISDCRDRLIGGPANDCETVLGKAEEDVSAMISTNAVLACRQDDDNDDSETMNIPAHKKKGLEVIQTHPRDEDNTNKLSESGERMVADAREEIDDTLFVEVPDESERTSFTPITGPVSNFPPERQDQRRAELKEQLKKDPDIQKVITLLQENTLEDHEEALRILASKEILAIQRYGDIHTNPDEEKKNFSEVSPDRVNPFARSVLEKLELGERSIILELGSGFGNDSMYFARNSRAHVVGVDRAEAAIEGATRILRNPDKQADLDWIEDSLQAICDGHGKSFEETRDLLQAMADQDRCTTKNVRRRRNLVPKAYKDEIAEAVRRMNTARERVEYPCHDYLEVLASSGGMGIDMIYSHSTLHYAPPLVLQQKTFPMIAEALRDVTTGERGRFCLAMKIGSSASAVSKDQFRLGKNDPYNPSIDVKDNIFRIYPQTKEEVISLVGPSFDIVEIDVVPNHGYDKNGDTEMMCQAILIPKSA